MPYNKSEGGAPMRRRPMRRRKKVCVFCSDKNQVIDYKDVATLSKYISSVERSFLAVLLEHVLSTREQSLLLLSVLDRLHLFLT